MMLFDKKKDLILRMTNSILLVGFIISLTVLYNGFVNYSFKAKPMKYILYEEEECNYLCDDVCLLKGKEVTEKEKCEFYYEQYKIDMRKEKTSYKKQMIISTLSTITFGTFMFLLNKEEKPKKKKRK